MEYKGLKMIKTASGRYWIADLISKTCWNCETKLVVSFEDNGSDLEPKIKEIPVELIKKFEHDPMGKKFIGNLIKEAKEAYIRAYYYSAFTNAVCFKD